MIHSPSKIFYQVILNVIALASAVVCITMTSICVPTVCYAVTADLELPPWVWREGSWGVSAWGDYSMSNANYGQKMGSFTKLPTGNQFNALETNYKGRFAFLDHLSIYLGAGFNDSMTKDQGVARTNGLPTQAFLGADFNIPNHWARLISEVEIGMPMHQFHINDSLLSTGESTTYGRGSLFFFKPIRLRPKSYMDLLGHVSLYVPADDLAKLAMMELGIEIPLGSSVAMGAAGEGFTPVMSDSSSRASRLYYASIAEAQSGRYDAFNPTLIEAKAWLRFLPRPGYNFRLGYSRSVNGANTAAVQALTLDLQFNFASIYQTVSPPHAVPARPEDNKIDRLFHENTVRERNGERFVPDDRKDDVDDSATAPQ